MIKSIFLCSEKGAELEETESVRVIAGSGIIGDRHFNQSKWPGQNITFIATEAIEEYNRQNNQSISAADTRRNIITEGVDLNALVGKRFSIGEAHFEGVELCEPCKSLGEQLSNETISNPEVVKAFLSRGGLRANVCRDGEITIGMTFQVLSS